MPEELVAWIELLSQGVRRIRRINARRLLVGGRQKHQSVNRLQTPIVFHELVRQPIEQLGMRRRLTHRAEIVARRDDSLAEMMLPKAVDNNSRGERMIGQRQPAGQGAAAAA